MELPRPAARDLVLSGVVVAMGAALTYSPGADPVRADAVGALALLPLAAPAAWRRTAPAHALAGLLAVVVALDLLLGPDVPRCLLVPPLVFLLVFSAGTRLEQREAVTGLGLGIVLLAAEAITTYGGFAFVVIPLAAILWGIARLVRSRRRMADQLRARTAHLRALRDERAQLDVAAERLRLAGELDALVQRRLQALARMAGDPPARPEAATATLVAIEEESRRTLDDMRAIVGVLRDDGQAPATDPLPTLAHLEAMLVRSKGDQARLTVTGDPRVLPPGVELSAYRIVEHLLAALDDAPGVDVRVGFRDDALELAVSGPAHRQANEALDRARERVALHSGTLAASTRGRRAEAVVSLPVLAG